MRSTRELEAAVADRWPQLWKASDRRARIVLLQLEANWELLHPVSRSVLSSPGWPARDRSAAADSQVDHPS